MTDPTIDINCDMGEGGANDQALLRHVTSANIACGVHAGSCELMRRTMALASAAGVGIGAHPGLADRAGMGRRETAVLPQEAAELIAAQVGAMAAAAREMGLSVRHVKPHGALYNQAARNAALARAVAEAVRGIQPNVIFFALAGSAMVEAGCDAGLRVAREAYADRRYLADGSLAPRGQIGATIEDPHAAAAQALRLTTEHRLTAIDGTELTIEAQTICVHGDNPNAVEIVARVRESLESAGVKVRRVFQCECP